MRFYLSLCTIATAVFLAVASPVLAAGPRITVDRADRVALRAAETAMVESQKQWVDYLAERDAEIAEATALGYPDDLAEITAEYSPERDFVSYLTIDRYELDDCEVVGQRQRKAECDVTFWLSDESGTNATGFHGTACDDSINLKTTRRNRVRVSFDGWHCDAEYADEAAPYSY